jgi:predicted nucleic acid-binding protein
MAAETFFDTSVLVYAFDSSEVKKHDIALNMINRITASGGGVISSQVLLELYNVLTRFAANPLTSKETGGIVKYFTEASMGRKIDYNLPIAIRAVEAAARFKTNIWDTLIAETMKENGVYTIATENEKDFKKIKGITIINPFKK